jgi:hypothetical protein
MRLSVFILFVSLLSVSACKTKKQTTEVTRSKPQWTSTRPIDNNYYIGIGIVNKNVGADYQSVGKKNAINDLVSEIKVTVNTQSLLSQFQDNTEFRQKFESETRLAALNTIEGFEVVDSWEDQTTYFVYYRLSKEKYEEIKRRKMMAAIDRAENFYKQSLQLNAINDYMQILRLKIRSLAAVQDYLNENIEVNIGGRNVSLISEVLSSLQKQLIQLKVESSIKQISGKVGKPVATPIKALAFDASSKLPLAYVPLIFQSESGKVRGGAAVPTNESGNADLNILSIMSRDPVQTVKIVPDIKSIMQVDSLNDILKNILTRMDVNSHLIRIQVTPLNIYINANEQNYSGKMSNAPIETLIRRTLNENGCVFVSTPEQADYTLTLTANTEKAQAIWGNMQTANLSVSIVLYDMNLKSSVYKDGISDIKGYHTTSEQAGMDAYKQGLEKFNKEVLPKLMAELYRLN